MSQQPSIFSARQRPAPAVPRGETVASYDTYLEAQQAVDLLVKADFHVQDVSIVGNDLKSVERVTGRLTYGRAAGAGALSGLYVGLLFGLVVFLFNPVSDLTVFLGVALVGAAGGMIFGVASYGLTRRIRDFTSTREVLAASYSLIVKPDSANRARNILGVDTAATTTVITADEVAERGDDADPTQGPTAV